MVGAMENSRTLEAKTEGREVGKVFYSKRTGSVEQIVWRPGIGQKKQEEWCMNIHVKDLECCMTKIPIGLGIW